MQKIQLDKTYNFDVPNVSFGDLSQDEVYDILQDGRHASPFMEKQLTKWFPELKHITGNKNHDHLWGDQKLDAKNFTKGGLKFMPSKMLGTGRTVDLSEVKKKASELIYICCDIVEFPKVRIRFIDGLKLLSQYPTATVPVRDREMFFACDREALAA